MRGRSGYYQQVARCLQQDVLPFLGENQVWAFLVGAARGTGGSIRDELREQLLLRGTWGMDLQVYYPEDLFEDILRQRGAPDLLSLENLLARSVHAVVIVVESPGSICELGAFANHDPLRSKLIAVVDKRYRRQRSFIMLGPVRSLERHNEESVLYWHLSKGDVPLLADHLLKRIRKLSQASSVDRSLGNPLLSQLCVLAAAYVMQPVAEEELGAVLEAAPQAAAADGPIAARAALSGLLGQEQIVLRSGRHEVAPRGEQRLEEAIKRGARRSQVWGSLDALRVERLNRILRRTRQHVA